MQQGLFVESGPVRTILKNPSHPYTQSLLDAILDEGPARGPLVTSTAGTAGVTEGVAR
jgi:ABC-type dipeptide/oligopeptide/nickel transport system ATPase component